VESLAISVNTEQATVQGLLTAQQIENLPVNGRNFLDLAQLEPGVQIQDGANFDPRRTVFPPSLSRGISGGLPELKSMGLISATRRSVPPHKISHRSPSVNFRWPIESGSLNGADLHGHDQCRDALGSDDIHGEGFFYWRGDSVAAKQSLIPCPSIVNSTGRAWAGQS